MSYPLRLAGHGVAVVPRPPFTLERHGGRGGDAVVVTHVPPGGVPRRLVVVPGGTAAACRVEPGAGVAAAEQVAEVGAGPGHPGWRVEAAGISLAWPEGFRVQPSPAPDRAPGFDLAAPGGVVLFAQGPLAAEAAPGEGALTGPGQRVDGRGQDGDLSWVELTFLNEWVPWRARHCVMPVGERRLVLTIQAPEASVGGPAWRAAVEAAKTARRA